MQQQNFSDIVNPPQAQTSQLQAILNDTPAMSLPNGIIYVAPPNLLSAGSVQYPNARATVDEYCAIFIHEVFHQFQYQCADEAAKKSTFNQLIQEMWDNMRGKIVGTIQNTNINIIEQILGGSGDPMLNFLSNAGSIAGAGKVTYDPYAFQYFIGLPSSGIPAIRDASLVRDLQQISTLEGQARFIEDFALAYIDNQDLTPYKKAMRDNKHDSKISTRVPL
jgi:hypothetical protein